MWIEKTTSRSCSVDKFGNATGVREYHVWYDRTSSPIVFERTQILQDPASIQNAQGVPLPDIGSKWQAVSAAGSSLDNPDRELVLYRYSVVGEDGQKYTVRADYSNDPFLVTSIADYSVSAYYQNVSIPWARAKPIYVNNTTGIYHQQDSHKIQTQYRRLTVSVSIPASKIIDCIAISGAQAGSVHEFGGQAWLFQSGDVVRKTPFFALATYVWMHDNGNKAVEWPRIPAPNCGVEPLSGRCSITNHVFPSQRTWPDSENPILMSMLNRIYRTTDNLPAWTRPPYHDVAYANPICPAQCPTFYIQTEFIPQSNGWKSLPGKEYFPAVLFER